MSGRFLRALSCPALSSRPCPLLFVAAGLVALAAGAVVLRSFGPGYRIGRLLARRRSQRRRGPGAGRRRRGTSRSTAGSTPRTSSRTTPIVRSCSAGSRLEHPRRPAGWTTFDEQREAVTFGVNEGLDGIAVDDEALDEGLVVESARIIGTAADIAGPRPAGPRPRPRSVSASSRSRRSSTRSRSASRAMPRRAILLTAGLGRPLDRDHARARRGDARPDGGRSGDARRRGELPGAGWVLASSGSPRRLGVVV